MTPALAVVEENTRNAAVNNPKHILKLKSHRSVSPVAFLINISDLITSELNLSQQSHLLKMSYF